MSRKPRVYCESGIYHVIVRGNDQQSIFYDDVDRKFFLNRLEKYSSELDIQVYAYCLMSNHVHLLIGNGNEYMSKLIQKLLTSYVGMFNRKYNRSGHLFQGRFLSEPVENDSRFKTVVRYIHQNPEKVGLDRYDSFIWSSFHRIIENSKDESLVTASYVINNFGNIDAFLKFHSAYNVDYCLEYENKRFISDNLASDIIKNIFIETSSWDIRKLPEKELKNGLKLLKNQGISISQISRLIGVSKYIVRKA